MDKSSQWLIVLLVAWLPWRSWATDAHRRLLPGSAPKAAPEYRFDAPEDFFITFKARHPELVPDPRFRDPILQVALKALDDYAKSAKKSTMTRSEFVDREVSKKIAPGVLLFAAQHRDVASVKALLDGGAPVDSVNASGETSLILAAIEGQAEATRLLLARGANVAHRDNKGGSAFSAALVNGRGAIVDQLVEKGAAVNDIYWEGITPLILAAQAGNLAIVKSLVARGARLEAQTNDTYHTTALTQAVFRGHEEVARYLASKGATYSLYHRTEDNGVKLEPLRSACRVGLEVPGNQSLAALPCSELSPKLLGEWACGKPLRSCE